MPSTIRRVLMLLVLAFLVYAVVANPDQAMDILRAVWDLLRESFLDIGRYLNRLTDTWW